MAEHEKWRVLTQLRPLSLPRFPIGRLWPIAFLFVWMSKLLIFLRLTCQLFYSSSARPLSEGMSFSVRQCSLEIKKTLYWKHPLCLLLWCFVWTPGGKLRFHGDGPPGVYFHGDAAGPSMSVYVCNVLFWRNRLNSENSPIRSNHSLTTVLDPEKGLLHLCSKIWRSVGLWQDQLGES